jgi:hypothetical protein
MMSLEQHTQCFFIFFYLFKKDYEQQMATSSSPHWNKTLELSTGKHWFKQILLSNIYNMIEHKFYNLYEVLSSTIQT